MKDIPKKGKCFCLNKLRFEVKDLSMTTAIIIWVTANISLLIGIRIGKKIERMNRESEI